MISRTKNNVVTRAFDSLPELARYLEETPRTWRERSSEKTPPRLQWCLKTPYGKALELAEYGWPEGALTLKQALKLLPARTPKPQTKNDFYGFAPNVPRFCAGAPDCMVRRNGEESGGKVLTLYVPVNALARVSAEHMSNFGLAVVACIEQLEADGTRVEVIGAFCSAISGKVGVETWVIKRADQFFDYAVMAFAVGHPAMFRRIGFALRERSSIREDRGYGKSIDLKESMLIDPPSGAIILNGMREADVSATTPEKAFRFVSRCIETALNREAEHD